MSDESDKSFVVLGRRNPARAFFSARFPPPQGGKLQRWGDVVDISDAPLSNDAPDAEVKGGGLSRLSTEAQAAIRALEAVGSRQRVQVKVMFSADSGNIHKLEVRQLDNHDPTKRATICLSESLIKKLLVLLKLIDEREVHLAGEDGASPRMEPWEALNPDEQQKVIQAATEDDGFVEELFRAHPERGPALVKAVWEAMSQAPEGADTMARTLDVLAGLRLNDLSLVEALELKRRRCAIEEFERMLGEKTDELYWQEFFNQHRWIFGLGLDVHLLVGGNQLHVPVPGALRQAARVTDAMLHTEATHALTTIVEIKLPSTSLVTGGAHRKELTYPHAEVLGGIAQLLQTAERLDAVGPNGEMESVAPELRAKRIRQHGARLILLVGRRDALRNRDQRASFDRFIATISGVTVLGFDELLARAKAIVFGMPGARRQG